MKYTRKAASENWPHRIVVRLAEPDSRAGKDLNYTSKYTENKHKTIFNIIYYFDIKMLPFKSHITTLEFITKS